MVLLECSITSILAIVIVRSIVIVQYVQSHSEFDHWRICHAFYQIAWNFVTSLMSSNMFFFAFRKIEHFWFTLNLTVVFCLFREAEYPEIFRRFPAAQVHHIPDAGHWVHSEKPQEFLEVVLDFINM